MCVLLGRGGIWYASRRLLVRPIVVHDKLSTTTLESLLSQRLGDGKVWAVAFGVTLRELI